MTHPEPDSRGPCEVPPGVSGIFRTPKVACRRQHARRLLAASVIFGISLVATLALVTAFVLRDLSEARVNEILSQARDEAEAVAQFVTDPSTMGEGETVERVDGTQDREIDPQSLLDDVMPKVFDAQGNAIDPLQSSPLARPGPRQELPGASRPITRRVPANLSRQGQEWLTLVNGELVQRDAFQFIEIKYPGGKRILSFRDSDMRDWDRSVLREGTTHVEQVRRLYRPSSERITLAWDSTLDGQPVRLQAGIDVAVLEEGVADLRRKTIPKVLVGAAVFLVLLGVAYAYVFRLLGEARRLENEASQQALLAQVGMLAAGLAHEIRNPLSAVQMNLQLLEEDLEEAPAAAPPGAASSSSRDAGAREHVALLHATQREIRRLGSLVSDFLTYARPMTPRPAPVRLDALVRDCAELFRANAAGAGISLDLDLQAGDDPVLLDEAMVKQALMNVVKNALEAVPSPGGRVSVATRRAEDLVQVSVSDNGPGVPEDPEQMFRVFHSTKKGGTGLGLPISRALAERQQGRLQARQGASGGAVFVLTLPARTAEPAETAGALA